MFLTIIILLLLSPVFAYLAMIINKYTKIPPLLLFIGFGLIFQYLKITDITVINDGVANYTQAISITMIYIMAGQVFNLKKQDSIVFKLGTIPLTLTILFNFILFMGLQMVLAPSLNFSPWLILSLLGIAAASTPVLFLLFYNKLPVEQEEDPKVIGILNGAVFDQIPSMLYIIIPITLGIGIIHGNGNLTNTFVQLLVQILVLIIGILIGFVVGKIILQLTLKYLKAYMLVPILVASSVLCVLLIPFLAGQYLLVAVGVGLAINSMKTPEANVLKKEVSKLSNLFSFPIMFISLGMTISLMQIFNWKMILLAILLFVLINCVKAFITKVILVKNNYDVTQKRIGITFTLLTGATYINMAISFKPYFMALGYPHIDISISIIGIILYIFSIIMIPVYANQKSPIVDKIFKLK